MVAVEFLLGCGAVCGSWRVLFAVLAGDPEYLGRAHVCSGYFSTRPEEIKKCRLKYGACTSLSRIRSGCTNASRVIRLQQTHALIVAELSSFHAG